MTDPAICLRDVAVAYDGRRVLQGVNLDIARGGATMTTFETPWRTFELPRRISIS